LWKRTKQAGAAEYFDDDVIKAVEVARSVAGVKSVKNDMRIK